MTDLDAKGELKKASSRQIVNKEVNRKPAIAGIPGGGIGCEVIPEAAEVL